MKRLAAIVFVLAGLGAAAIAFAHPAAKPRVPEPVWTLAFEDRFERTAEMTETRAPEMSADANWWLGSGGGLRFADGVASTWVGEAPKGYYRSRYALRDPVDTDGGLYPQNLFRVVTRSAWQGDVHVGARFRILRYNLSESPQRYDPNGLLLFSRYVDANNLYYAGIRVDGHAIVKKKSAGVYYTLAEKQVFDGTYDRERNPLLLPTNTWIGLRAVTRNRPDGSVAVSLYLDEGRGRGWRSLVEGVDAGVGGKPLAGPGRTGIRTDFMDVQFDDYRVAVAR